MGGEQLMNQNYRARTDIAESTFVKFGDADYEVVKCGAGDNACGISDKLVNIPNGETLDVGHLGITWLRLGNTVTRGDLLIPDTNGFGVAASGATRPIAMALQSGLSGDLIRVFVSALGTKSAA